MPDDGAVELVGFPEAGPGAWVVDPRGLDFDSPLNLDWDVPVSAPHSPGWSGSDEVAEPGPADPGSLGVGFLGEPGFICDKWGVPRES